MENSAAANGGGLYFKGATGSTVNDGFRAERSYFALNDAAERGGAIHFAKLGIPAEASAGITVDEPSWIFSSEFYRNSGGAEFATTGVGGGAINIEDRIDSTALIDTGNDPDDFDDMAGAGNDPTPQDQSLTLEISNSEFRGNITDGLGSSIRIVPASTTSGGRIIIRQCTMAGDSVTSVETATMDSTTIYQTGTEIGPPGVDGLDLRTTLLLACVVMAPNALPSATSALDAIGPPTIVGSTAGNFYDTTKLVAAQSDVQQSGGAVIHGSGSSSINADPDFVNFGVGDLRLESTSPCIDEGYPVGIGLSRDYPDLDEDALTVRLPLDLDELTRVIDAGGGAISDMGAYEYDDN